MKGTGSSMKSRSVERRAVQSLWNLTAHRMQLCDGNCHPRCTPCSLDQHTGPCNKASLNGRTEYTLRPAWSVACSGPPCHRTNPFATSPTTGANTCGSPVCPQQPSRGARVQTLGRLSYGSAAATSHKYHPSCASHPWNEAAADTQNLRSSGSAIWGGASPCCLGGATPTRRNLKHHVLGTRWRPLA